MMQEVRVVDRNDKRVAGFPVEALLAWRRAAMSAFREETSCRHLLQDRRQGRNDFRRRHYQIEQTEKGVHVGFKRGISRDFDLVIGADGLHSRIREIVFGAEDKFEKYLGYKVAAFAVEGYRPRDELVYVMYTQVGQQVGRFAMREDRTMFLFIFREDERRGADDPQAQKALLRKRFGNSGWECPKILDALDGTKDLYFDRVSQI